MKRNFVILLISLIIVCSCDTYTGAGAYAGSQVGGMLGSFVGGISGGWRGSDIGGLVGMAGGAMVGAAVGSAADAKAEAKVRERAEVRRESKSKRYDKQDSYSDNGYDNYLDESNSGDDRIDFTPSDNHAIEVRRVHFIDSNGSDQSLSGGELSKVSMEIFNTTPNDIYNVQAVVENASGNKHVQLSAPVVVERIAAGKGVRYTAMIRADKRLRNGTITLKAYALQNGKQISRTETFTLVTKKR